MVDDLAATRYPRNAVASLVNARVQPDGTALRRDGSVRVNDEPIVESGIGYGAIEFTTADGTVQICAFVDDEFHVSEDGGETWEDKTEDIVLDAGYYDFATMRVGSTNYLFAANGADSVWRWDGAALDALPNAPAGVQFVAVFNSRLWVTGHNGVLVQASQVANPTVYASPFGLTVQVMVHHGETPTGLYQVGPHLLVFDRESTSYIDGYGEQTLIVAAGATGFSRSVGCIAFRTIRGVGENAVCWLSQRGIEYYTPGSGITLVSRGLQRFFLTINRVGINERPGQPSAVYDDVTQEYLCALSTTGIQNDRVIVVNLLHRGQGWLGALTIDDIRGAGSPVGQLFFQEDDDGYLETDPGGTALGLDSQGYATLSEVGQGILPTVEDDGGYLSTSITDSVAASLFVASDVSRGTAVHSLGYDGFCRRHYGVSLDDVASDGTNGLSVVMEIVSRPFLFGSPRQRKRVRGVHLASLQTASASALISLRVNGATVGEQTITVNATSLNQPKRGLVRTHAIGDAPQVRLTTTDAMRVALIGVSAELMREQI
jgi:hypothetical protein